jgi:RHS repeat-associated protein
MRHLGRAMSALAVGLALLLLSGSQRPVFAWGGYPSESPGPPCDCSSPGGSGGGGAPVCGGKPIFSVSQFTGDLIITDMPAPYQDPCGGPPWVMTWSAQSSRSSALGPGWTHTYNFQIMPDGTNGVGFVDGNGRETYFSTTGGSYTPPAGRHCGVIAMGPDPQQPTSWEVRRPDPTALILTLDANGVATGFRDADDQVWEFVYGANGLLGQVIDPSRPLLPPTFKYNADGTLWRMGPASTEPFFAEFTYDTNDPKRLSTVKDIAGQVYTFGYDGTDTKITSITDPSGRRFEFLYSTFDDKPVISVISVAGLQGSARRYFYEDYDDGIHNVHKRYVDVLETKDGQDRQTRFIYDRRTSPNRYGTLMQVIEDFGDPPHLNLTQDFTYNNELKLTEYQDSYEAETGGKAHRHHFYYDDSALPHRVTRIVDAQNVGTPWSYRFEYDNNTHDGAGLLTKVTTPQGREVDIAYDGPSARVSQVTVKDRDLSSNQFDHTTWYGYWDSTKGYQLRSITDAENHATTFYYDSAWRLDYIGWPLGYYYTDVGCDGFGRIASVTDPNGNRTSFSYDLLGRLTWIGYPDIGSGSGQWRHFEWDCCGLEQVTDENGVVTRLEYDPYTKWLTRVTEDCGTGGLNYVTQYGYDEVGNLTSVTNARGRTTTYTYDIADRLVQANYPDNTSESWDHHDDGRVASHTDGRGRTTSYHYDADDRLAAVGTLKAIDYPNDTDVGIGRDRDGLITSITDATGTSTAEYYDSGWLKRFTNGDGKATTFEYNHVGLLSKLTAPVTSKYFTYTYTDLNELSTVQDSSDPPITVSSFTYDLGGRLTRITRPGSYIDFTYNARDWITGVHNRKSDGSTLYDNTYYYQDGSLWDFVGNPLKRTEFVDGTTYTTTYRYDDVYRLLRETRSGYYNLVYSYDEVGNRRTRGTGGLYPIAYSYDSNDKLASAMVHFGGRASFGYDGAGNLTSVSGDLLGSWSFAYDDEGRPTSISYPGGTDAFTYNAFGQRTRANLDGAIFRYVYAGDRVLERTDDSGGVLARYTPADASYPAPLLYFRHNDGTHHYPLADIIGTARRLVSETATVTDTYSLDAFGRQLSTSGPTMNPYRFGSAWGYITDTASSAQGSGLIQMGARFYWPEIGRFIQQDPIGDGMNWYAYAVNNPVVWVDPTGLLTWREARDWYMGGMGGASDFVDEVVLGGATTRFGETAGRWDFGCASDWDLVGAAANWGGRVGMTAWSGGQTLAAINRATAMTGLVTHWGPKAGLRPGDWVIVGGRTRLNQALSLIPGKYPYESATSATVISKGVLQVPGGPLRLMHQILGHRIYLPH